MEERISAYGGVQPKPPGCSECPYRTIGKGFCPDWNPTSSKMAFWLEAPGQDEILYSEPLVGRAGYVWQNTLLAPHGLTKADVLIVNGIRCNAPYNKYPTGKMRVAAESMCRQYDDIAGKHMEKSGLVSWKPDMFIITMHPAVLLRTTAPYRLILGHLGKALEFVRMGRRPVVLMGDKAKSIVAPWLEGGVKAWSGHWEDWTYDRINRAFS